MTEVWKKVPDYENYEISNYGRVRKGNKILKETYYQNGYVSCGLWKNNHRKMFQMHRLVMMLFKPDRSNFKYMSYEDISNIDISKLEINHIDENTKNNCVDNLEWCTSKYNANYGHRNKKCRDCNRINFKPVAQYDKLNNLIAIYDCINDAAKHVNGDHSFIARVAKGYNKTAYGFIWKFIDE